MLEKMQELIADQLSVDADSITEASSFKDDLGADSLDLYELIMALEEEYDVDYSDFRFIPINLFKYCFYKISKQVCRNNCFNNLLQVD